MWNFIKLFSYIKFCMMTVEMRSPSPVRVRVFLVQEGVELLVRNHSSLLDARLLTGKIAEVVDTSTANNTILVNLDLVDVGRVERENTLNTYAIRDLTDGEHLGLTRTLDLDNYAAEALQTLLVTLNDFVGYGDCVTSLELGNVSVGLCPHLLIHHLDNCIFVHLVATN